MMATKVVGEVPGRHNVHVITKLEKLFSADYGVRNKETGRAESESFSTLAEATARAQELAKKS
jgi:hypothetical protein